MDLIAIEESQPGEKWYRNFLAKWPPYRSWFLREGLEARPSLDEGRRALRDHMPELMSVYERLCDLVGDDEVAHRFLTFYCPPPVITGCSVAVAPMQDPVLVRNYDFSPEFFESSVLSTHWRKTRRVIVSSEAFWGALDGINDAGLVVALTFGGRLARGKGFGIPVLLRYVLECCQTTEEAVEALRAVPCAGVQNVLVLDRAGNYAVVFLSPDRPPIVRHHGLTTNHQDCIEWDEAARWSLTAERADLLRSLQAGDRKSIDHWVDRFHAPPLYRRDYAEWLGTLYTAVYRPDQGKVTFHWPDQPAWVQSFEAFQEGARPLPV